MFPEDKCHTFFISQSAHPQSIISMLAPLPSLTGLTVTGQRLSKVIWPWASHFNFAESQFAHLEKISYPVLGTVMRKYRKSHKNMKRWVKAKIDVLFYLLMGKASQGRVTSPAGSWNGSQVTPLIRRPWTRHFFSLRPIGITHILLILQEEIKIKLFWQC